MTITATVNYHIHKPERQAFVLDANGIAGNFISPELQRTQVSVVDVRTEQTETTFESSSVGFATLQTDVDVLDDASIWQPVYEAEIENLLKSKLGLEEVIVFDHTVRIDDDLSDRKPACNVHSDYSPEGARQRLIDLLGKTRAANWASMHYAFINVWRPVEIAINSSPLGFILPSSVKQEDWILLDLVYPDRYGQIMGLAANPEHEWIYRSKMNPEEVAYFNIFDNQGQPSISHSAMDMIENRQVHTIRKSIESRTLVRYSNRLR